MSDTEYSESLEAGPEYNDDTVNLSANNTSPSSSSAESSNLSSSILSESAENHDINEPGEIEEEDFDENDRNDNDDDEDEGQGDDCSIDDNDSDKNQDDDSDTSSEEEEDSFELAQIGNEVFSLPRGLCENSAIFYQFFSLETWKQLPSQIQNHLVQFLPQFNHILEPKMAAVEQNRTLEMFFNNELDRFGQTPLSHFQKELEIGNYRPDILRLRQNISKSKRREHRFQECEYISQLAKQLFLSRQHLIQNLNQTTNKLNEQTILKLNRFSKEELIKPQHMHLYNDNKLSAIRARKRFYTEISRISMELNLKSDDLSSSDENDNAEMLFEKNKNERSYQTLDNDNDIMKSNSNPSERCIFNTLFERDSKMNDDEACLKQQKSRLEYLNDKNFKHHLIEHKRRKLTEPTRPEFDTSDIRLRDVCVRAQLGGDFKRLFALSKVMARKTKTSSNNNTSKYICNASYLKNGKMDISNTKNDNKSKSFELPALVPIQQGKKNEIQPNIVNYVPATTNTVKRKSHKSMNSIKLDNKATIAKIMPTDMSPTSLLHGMRVGLSETKINQMCLYGEKSLMKSESNVFDAITKELELKQSKLIDNEILNTNNSSTLPISDDTKVLPPPLLAPVIMEKKLSNLTDNSAKIATLVSNYSNINPTTKSTTNIDSNTDSVHNNNNTNNHYSQIPMPKLEPISTNQAQESNYILQQDIGSNQIKKLSPLETTSSLSDNTSSIVSGTHASYFSLIRDLFCSTANHRMRYDELRGKIEHWLQSSTITSNDWYSMADNWLTLLKSAINFLIGDFVNLPDEYVPFIEYKSQINIYQWIGAGRDSDHRLGTLCSIWFEKRRHTSKKLNFTSRTSDHKTLRLTTNVKSISENNGAIASDGNNGGSNASQAPLPPPPRYPTTWTVRPATPSEIQEFQQQERERFEQPHKAYTYRMYGYESVVGPVKGIYTPMLALTKARGHSMMIGNRPNFVTILTLVRDATARLPNGEGTRADISELLKCSQYINRDAAENVLQTIVSGALDRMHTENDPCVRYDPKRKIWIYLHRDRTEEEFERFHQQNQSVIKPKKLNSRKSKQSTNKLNSGAKETVATSPAKSAEPVPRINLPALVPANNIINMQNQNNNVDSKQTTLSTVLPPQLARISNPTQASSISPKCLPVSPVVPPVPPLKYNIPSSILNTNIQQLQSQTQLSQKPYNVMQTRIDNKINETDKVSELLPSSGITNVTFKSGNQVIQQKRNIVHSSNASVSTSTTPILVATPQGLQTVHVVNVNPVILGSNAAVNAKLSLSKGMQQQKLPTDQSEPELSSAITEDGRRVTLSKPIMINQMNLLNHNKNTLLSSEVILKDADKCKPSVQQINPIMTQLSSNSTNITSTISLASQPSSVMSYYSTFSSTALGLSSESTTDTISSATSFSTMSTATISRPTTLTSNKNIIRLVAGPNMKGLLNASSGQIVGKPARILSTSMMEKMLPLSLSGGTRLASVEPAAGQYIQTSSRTIDNSIIEDAIGNINPIEKDGKQTLNLSTTGVMNMPSIVKMAPGQTYINLIPNQAASATGSEQGSALALSATPQVPQTNLLIKSIGCTNLSTNSNLSKPHHVILENSAIRLPSQNTAIIGNQTSNNSPKNIMIQKVITTSEVTSSPTLTNAPTVGVLSKLQRIGVTDNSVSQQQKILIQNVKVQQQQTINLQSSTRVMHQTPIKFKPVQVIAGGNLSGTTNQSIESESNQTVVQNIISPALQQQLSNFGRIIKTVAPLKTVESGTASCGQRIISTNPANCQIVSLENLLQKQGGALRLRSCLPTIVKRSAQLTNSPTTIIEEPLSERTVVVTASSKSINANSIITSCTTKADVSIYNARTLSSQLVNTFATNLGRVVATAGTTTAKIINKSGAAAGNIRVLSSGGQIGSNLNFVTLQGKPVMLAAAPSKPINAANVVTVKTTGIPSQSNVSLANTNIIFGGQTIKLPQGRNIMNKTVTATTSVSNLISNVASGGGGGAAATQSLHTVILGNQVLRVQPMHPFIATNRAKIVSNQQSTSTSLGSSIVVGSSNRIDSVVSTENFVDQHQRLNLSASAIINSTTTTPNSSGNTTILQNVRNDMTRVRLATGVTANSNRVVLAVQGGNQFFLTPTVSANSSSLKTLGNMKVVSLGPATQIKSDVPKTTTIVNASEPNTETEGIH